MTIYPSPIYVVACAPTQVPPGTPRQGYVVRWTRLSVPIDLLTEQFRSAIAKLGTDLLNAIFMKTDIHHQKGQLGENLR
jgi:hypothetical protein